MFYSLVHTIIDDFIDVSDNVSNCPIVVFIVSLFKNSPVLSSLIFIIESEKSNI